MTNYWVFVVVDHKGRDGQNAAKVFETRVRKKFWALPPNAAHVKKVQEGDKAVLCLGGTYCRGFVGSAVLASGLQNLTTELRRQIRGLPSERFTHYVKFSSVKSFKQIICLGDYVGEVSFLKGGKRPRLPQGSIIRIDRKQYDRLTRSD